MDSTIDLVTSMSPKLPKKSNKSAPKAQKLTKLALKKSIRRTSIYDKLMPSINNSKLILQDASSTSSLASSSSKSNPVVKDSREESAIEIISSSSDEEVSKKEHYKDLPTNTENSIKKWLSDVNSAQNNVFSSQTKCPSNFSAINSTFIPEKSAIGFDDFINKKMGDSLMHSANPLKEISKDLDLGENNKIDKLSPKNGSPINKELGNNANDFKTPIHKMKNKVSSHKIPLGSNKKLEAQLKSEDLRTLNVEKPPNEVEIPSTKLNKINNDNDTKTELDELPKTPVQNQDEIEFVLDTLYGNSWRKNKDQVFSTPRRVPPKKRPDLEKLARTEVKKPDKMFYPNPYLDSEQKKSKDLLKSLHLARINRNKNCPYFGTPQFVDEDTDKENSMIGTNSNSNKNVPKRTTRTTRKPHKLFFDDEDEDFIVSTDGTISESSGDDSEDDIRPINDFRRRFRVSSPRISDNELVQPKTPFKSKPNKIDNELSEKLSTVTITKRKVATKSFLASLSKSVPLEISDPKATIYRNSFQKHRDQLTKELFELFNSKVFDNRLPIDTPLIWNPRLRRTAGKCICSKTVKNGKVLSRMVKVQLSVKVLDSADRLRDTLIHEMCHAATYIVNEVCDGHGSYWQSWTRKALKVFPELPPISRCHNYDISFKYTYKCVNCSYSFGRHSKSLNLETKRCGHCQGRFEVLINKVTKAGDTKQVPCTPKALTGFALFVKENYADYITTPGGSHKSAMKTLGEEYQKLKNK